MDKVSHHSPVDLFPHRSASHVPHKEERHIVYQPWLKLPETFSRCQLAYDSDELAELVGLITRKQMDNTKASRTCSDFGGPTYTLNLPEWPAPALALVVSRASSSCNA